MSVADLDKSYEQLMLEARVEYLEWIAEGKRSRKSDKAKFKAQRLAKLHARGLAEQF